MLTRSVQPKRFLKHRPHKVSTKGIDMPKVLPLCLIAALAKNAVIGHNNQLPWHLPDDLKHFKMLTLGKPIIMGRKTWDSLGKALPGRLNLVVSRSAQSAYKDAEIFNHLETAIARARSWALAHGATEIMLIGGGALYTQAIEQAERLYLTRIDLAPAGDTWFPEYSPHHWALLEQHPHSATDTTPAYTFETWTRTHKSE